MLHLVYLVISKFTVIIFQKAMFFKSILNEFATKMNLEKVTYSTVKLEGHLFFRSSLVFNGKSYDGDPARTKKEAEQLAARKAIYSNLSRCPFDSANYVLTFFATVLINFLMQVILHWEQGFLR